MTTNAAVIDDIPFQDRDQSIPLNTRRTNAISATDTRPLVTVGMPTYNCAKYLPEAIESILSQTYENLELLILDGGSTDATLDIAIAYSKLDPRLKVKVYPGLPPAKRGNDALRTGLIQGKYLAIAHSDDISRLDRIEKQVEYCEQHPEISCCGTWMVAFASARETHPMESGIDRNQYPPNPKDVQFQLLYWWCLHFPTLFYRMSSMVDNGLEFDETYSSAGNYATSVQLSKFSYIANVPNYLLSYRCHSLQDGVVNRANSVEEAREIITNQLKDIGFYYEGYDIEAHCWFQEQRHGAEVEHRIDLKRLEKVLLEMYRFNLKHRLYPDEIVCQNLLAIWTHLSTWKALIDPIRSRAIFLASPLTRLSRRKTDTRLSLMSELSAIVRTARIPLPPSKSKHKKGQPKNREWELEHSPSFYHSDRKQAVKLK